MKKDTIKATYILTMSLKPVSAFLNSQFGIKIFQKFSKFFQFCTIDSHDPIQFETLFKF